MGSAPGPSIMSSRRASRAGLALLVWGALLGQADAAAAAAEGFRFVVYGGSQGSGPLHEAMVAQIAKLRPALVLHAGGFVGGNQRVADWRRSLEVVKPLLDLCSFYGCRGRNESSALCEAHEGFPQPDLKGVSYYSFDHGPVHFIALDTELPLNRDDRQTEWLREDLAAARARHIVVFAHRAVYGTAGRNVVGSGRMFWHPLFVKHKVRAVFSGGRHLYHRTAQDGVAYLITGGGGAALDLVRGLRDILPTDVVGAFHHCIEFTVSAEELRGRVVDPEGKTRDEFLLPLPPAASPAVPMPPQRTSP